MSCEHVSTYKKENGVYSYSLLHGYYVSCITQDSLKRKARECLCRTSPCELKFHRIHACLSCSFFGCFNGGHIHAHAKGKRHNLAVDTNHGNVFCFECNDYKYDAEFEIIAKKQKLNAACRRGLFVNYQWEPNSEEVYLLKEPQVINASDIGLRGIVNMGNTCYISVILQSLVHAPLFRDYFLSLEHKCNFENKLFESPDKIVENPPSCFACEIADIVQEFFSGKEEPYIPDRLLHLLWIREDQLKGYKQQDAHEFLLVLLHNLHLNCQGSNGNTAGDHLCQCVIDTIFTGFLKYEYTCTVCKNVFSQNASFKDLSLNNLDAHPNNGSNVSSLVDCLERTLQYVAQDITCKECDGIRTFNVQTILNKLPFIMSFHLNQPVDPKKYISFPEYLDMSPYVFPSKPQSNKGDNVGGVPKHFFYLFAVVEHTGNSHSGHYKCYVRRNKTNWFKCNDTEVKQVTIDKVLKINAYLLFYHRPVLENDLKNMVGKSCT